MGRGVFRSQPRVPARTLGASAVAEAQKYIAEAALGGGSGSGKVLRPGQHDKLMAAVGRRIADKRMLKLIRAFLTAGVMETGW